jgi:hypothetical protein
MNSLTDVYETMSAADGELLEKQAEAIKVAEEEDAAGRIMARGFMDELHKLAAPSFDTGSPIKDMGKGTTIKSKGYGAVGQGSDTNLPSRKGEGQAIMGGRKAKAPGTSNTMNMKPMAIGGGGPSMKSPFAGKGGGGLMASAVGKQEGQRTSAAPKSYANPGAAKPLNMGGKSSAGGVTGKLSLGNMPKPPRVASR